MYNDQEEANFCGEVFKCFYMNEREPQFRRYLAITVTGLTVSVHENLFRAADAKS